MMYRSNADGGLHGVTSLNRFTCWKTPFFSSEAVKSTQTGGKRLQILSRELPRVRTRAGRVVVLPLSAKLSVAGSQGAESILSFLTFLRLTVSVTSIGV